MKKLYLLFVNLSFICGSILSQSLTATINLRSVPSVLNAKYEKSPPFLVNNSQFLLKNTFSLRLLYKKMIFGVGVNYQSQKIKQNCIFIPGENDPYPNRDPFLSSDICTHIARGSHKVLDFPILLGITVLNKKVYNVYFLGTFSPILKYWQKISYIEKTTSEKFTLKHQQTNSFKETPISFSLGLSYEINNKIQLHTEPTFYSSNFRLETYLIGVGLGVSLRL